MIVDLTHNALRKIAGFRKVYCHSDRDTSARKENHAIFTEMEFTYLDPDKDPYFWAILLVMHSFIARDG